MYTAREVTTVLGLSPARLRSYLRAGTVTPARDADGELRFSFQDLALLRKAEGLVQERIPPRRVSHALRRLRERLGEQPLSAVQLAAEGRQVVASDGARRWEPTSGQVLLDLTAPSADAGDALPAPVVELRRKAPPPPVDEVTRGLGPDELYARACALEEREPERAVDLYRRVVDKQPKHADAHVNLGRLLHERGDPFGALEHYRAALVERPEDGTATFNLGVALEDLGRASEAMDQYERALILDQKNADAHYNLARLLEQAGRSDAAVRHLLAYRQLTRKPR
jgi:tetratricopeptide (TPR) repeat protein